jgi:hypothetical protein
MVFSRDIPLFSGKIREKECYILTVDVREQEGEYSLTLRTADPMPELSPDSAPRMSA